MMVTGRRRFDISLGLSLISLLAVFGCGGGGGGGGGGESIIPPFDSYGGITVTDMDGDGSADIAAAYSHISNPPPHKGYVRIWLQKQKDSFTKAGDYAVGSDPWHVISTDLNGDGVPDLVVSSATLAAEGPAVDLVTILLGDKANRGRFLDPLFLHAGSRIDEIAVRDLDGDGLPDIAATVYNNANGIVVFWQDAAAPGQFSAPDVVVTGEAFALAVGDLDADGRSDLVFVRSNTIMYAQHDKTQARMFATPVPILAGQNVSALGIVDLDRDGFDDLVVANRNTMDFGSSGYLLVARGNPNIPGTLLPPERYSLFARAFPLIFADMNRDGFLDIVTGEPYGVLPSDDRIEIFLQEPFTPGLLLDPIMNLAAPCEAYNLALVDTSDSGFPAVLASGGGVFLLMQNTAQPGSLLPPVQLP